MKIQRLATLLVVAPALLFGQPGSGTVTVPASNSSNPQPDQAVFSISVTSGIGQSLDSIVSALAGTGISAANLIGLSSSTSQSKTGVLTTQLGWTFRLVVPVTQIKNTTSSLLSVQKTIAQNNGGLTLSFNLQNTQVSPQLSQNCDFVSLINNARAEAQSIAGASGFTPGAVVGIAGSITQSIPVCSLTATFGLPVSRSGPNTITISASRTATTPADQASIQVDVISGLTAGLDDINAALAAAGITGASFTGAFTEFSQDQSDLDWSLTLTVPLGKLGSTLTQLTAAEQTVTKQKSSLSLSFYIQSLQVSPLAQPACDEAGLVLDARAQAQTLAAAAGVGVGPILSLSDQAISIPTAAYRNGDFSILATGFSNFVQANLAPAPTCSLSVQFQLL